MKIECCSRLILEYETKNWIKDLKNKETLSIKITPCDVLEGTFDLELKLRKK